ncbi:MAG: rhodanese-related sulfurtransferase, partial [Calditrichaeota bacterium]|nr:rhodanese-related sulfurtransferase [Calditrichota bacterium]
MQKSNYRVLLYYKFVTIENADVYAKRHLKFCKALGLKGRILVASEGINGTVSGTIDQTNAYIHALHMDPRFEDMIFKIDEVDQHAFKKIFVRHRDQIITLNHDENINPNDLTGTHLTPKEWLEAMQKDDTIIVDGRNDYEYEIGHFRNAIRPPLNAFKEFPKWIRENKQLFEGKRVLTYCTGGIRCEKLTGVFIREGLEDVYQLDGGIVTYGKDPEVKGRLWD